MSDSELEQLRVDMASKLQSHYPDVIRLLLYRPVKSNDRKKLAAVDHREVALVVAVTLKREDLVEKILRQGTSPFCTTPIGEPLQMTALTRNLSMGKLLLSRVMDTDTHRTLDPECATVAVNKGIELALESGSATDLQLAKYIAHWYLLNIGRMHTRRRGIFVELAVANSLCGFIRVFDDHFEPRIVAKLSMKAVKHAIHLRRPGQAIALLEEYVQHHGEPSKAELCTLFEDAVRLQYDELVEAVLKLNGTDAGKRDMQKALINKLRLGGTTDEILMVCIDQGLIQPEETYRFEDLHATFLYWCIYFQRLNLTKVMLGYCNICYNRLGFKDSSFYDRCDRTFQLAVEKNCQTTVELLLKAGYDPEAPRVAVSKSIWEVAKEGSKVRHLVHQATLEKIHFEIEGLGWEMREMRERSVWDPAKQTNVTVEYTFCPDEDLSMFNYAEN